MSGSECMEIQKADIKTEPTDSLEAENVYGFSSLMSRFTTVENRTISEADGRKDGSKKIKKTTRTIFQSDDLNNPHDCDSERYNSYIEPIFQSQKSDFLHQSQNSEDRKPSKEELKAYFNKMSQSLSGQSLSRNETFLYLAPSPASGKNRPVWVKTKDFITDLNLNPYVKLSPLSQTQLSSSHNESYQTNLFSKNENYFNTRVPDSEIMKTALNKDGITTYQCKKCNKMFKKKETLRQHFITHTDRFSCPYCTTRCKSRGDLNTHILSHTQEKPYHCDVCNTDYSRESILRKHKNTLLHLRACYKLENISSGCEKTYRDKHVDLFNTNETKLNIDGFSCYKCQKVSTIYAEHIKHVRSHSVKYICKICHKSFKSSSLLKNHKRIHNMPLSFFCKVCSRSFSNFNDLKEHAKSHKSTSSNKATEVAGCNDKDRLNMELQPGSNPEFGESLGNVVREFKCNKCQKQFSSRSHLRKHKCVRNKTYVCGTCYRTFINISRLKTHMKSHETVLHCDISDVPVSDDMELKNHVEKMHGDGNGFVCKLCYNHYDSATNLNHHMKDHTPTMLFSGRSLDESPLCVVDKTRTKSLSPGIFTSKMIKAEVSSDSEEILVPHHSEKVKIKNPSEKVGSPRFNDSDDDSILGSEDFYEIINTALDGSDDDLNDSEISDSDEELYSGIKTLLENEALVSSESDKSELDELTQLKKPLFHENVDIMKKHHEEFERYSQKDAENQNFTCILCDIVFHEERYLKNHLKQHVCEHCNQFFDDKEKLAAHKSLHVGQLLKLIKTEAQRLHIPKQKWKGYLMVSSESENELEDEIKNEIEDIDEIVSAQSESTNLLPLTLSHQVVKPNKYLFKEYSYIDLDNNIFACTVCERRYARPTTLRKHLKTHVCKICNKFFEDKSDLHEHKYGHSKKFVHVKARDKTQEVGISSSPVSKLNRNLFLRNSFIDADKHIFRCNVCQKDFVRKTVLTRHMKTHVCIHCDKFFEEKRDLAQHLTSHQKCKQRLEESVTDTDEHFKYDEDETQFTGTSSVVEGLGFELKKETLPLSSSLSVSHVISSISSKPQESSADKAMAVFPVLRAETSKSIDSKVLCGLNKATSFYQVASRPVHIVKNIASELCSATSTSHQGSNSIKIIPVSQNLIFSTPPEAQERPYECNECGKKFLRSGHLKAHLMIHTGYKPHVCSICDKAFGRGTVLRKHMKTHQKQCKVCQIIFTSKHLLDLHMEEHRTYLLDV